MKKRRNLLIAIVLIIVIVPVVITYAKYRYRFTEDDEAKVVVEVPSSWGNAVSIARRITSVTILFEGGHIVTVRHGAITRNSFYLVEIIYT